MSDQYDEMAIKLHDEYATRTCTFNNIVSSALRQAAEQATRAERERCAKIADSWINLNASIQTDGERIAFAILHPEVTQ
jgi:hypothetical protein